MPEKTSQQVNFGGGLNAQAAPHVLGQGEVQLATNVDFSLEWGALVCRRGSVLLGTAGTSGINYLTRNYNGIQTALDESPWYAVGDGVSGFYRGTGTVAFTQLFPGDSAATGPGVGVVYQSYAYLANGSVAIRDNGTNSYSWLLDQPPQPFVQIGTGNFNYPFAISNGTASQWPHVDPGSFNGTWTAGAVGRLVTAGGSPVLSTLTNGTNGTATDSGIIALATVLGSQTELFALATITVPNTNFNQPFPDTAPNPNSLVFGTGTTTITRTIGNFGVDYLQIGFSNPNAVVAISLDFSIGDASFSNYWHSQTTVGSIETAVPDPTTQLLSAQGNTSFSSYLASFQATAPHSRYNSQLSRAAKRGISLIQNLPDGIMAWANPRTNYQLIGTTVFGVGATGWENIGAVRVSIQTTDQTAMVIGTPVTYGNSSLDLTDTSNGLTWFQTIARVENGAVVAESTPSLPSEATGTATDTKGVLFQYGAALINLGAITGSATNGATHRIVYRQGGLLPDAYQVDMVPLTNGPIFTDSYYPDVQVVANSTLTRSLWSSWPTTGISAATIFQDRVFLGTGNRLFWSTPGNPVQIEADSDVVVSEQGDPIQALIPWGRLVITNNNSVYEIDGSVWEGLNQDWSLQKTGARRGCAAAKTCIRTPDGLVLFSYDGISLYYPGYGIDTPLDWVYDKIGDFWRGTATNNPAAQKGRIPALNFSAVANACAAYADHKIYLAAPTGTNTIGCDTLWVLDMSKKNIWMYQPQGYKISSLFWDYAGGRLVAGTTSGSVVQLETGQTDLGAAIPWSVRTQAWSTKQDMVIENLGVEALAANAPVVATAIVDNTNTYTLGTYNSNLKQWYTTPLLGTIGNNLTLTFSGTQTNSTNQQAIYQVSWDAMVQPQRVQYYRTDFDQGAGKDEKIWDVHYTEIDIQGTGTVTAVTFVDNVPLLTETFVGPTTVSQTPFPFPYGTTTGTLGGVGPQLIPSAFPTETYGNVAYTTYTSPTAGVTFKLYNSYYQTRPEPARVASFVSDRFNLHHLMYWKPDLEAWWHDVRIEMNCLGTPVLGTVMLDNVAIMTATLTGSGRQGYHFSYPTETYGNEAWVEFHSQGGVFKHYSTWYEYTEEPTRSLFFETPLIPFPSEAYLKTWLADLNPLNGTTTGTLFVDGVAVSTQTMTGNLRHVYEFGLPNVTTGKMIHALYSSNTPFKYWERQQSAFEFEPKPYAKTTWLVTYKKLGGVTQLDLARFFAMDIEGPVASTVTNTWIIDGVVFSTNTFTLTGVNAGEGSGVARVYNDQIPFPSGARGYLFQQQLTGALPFKVWRSNIDIDRVGVKGLSRVTMEGTPNPSMARPQ